MLNHKKKNSCNPLTCPKKRIIWIVASTLAMLIISLIVTQDLSWKPQYEARYEFRVRNYYKNVEEPELVLSGLSIHDSYWLYEYLSEQPAIADVERKLKYDNTEKITLLATGADSAMVASYAADLYNQACDTMEHYGDELSERLAEVLRKQIDSLSQPTTEGMDTLMETLYKRLVFVETSQASGLKYISLLNGAELPQAHKTPKRGWIILLSTAVAFLFSLIVCFLKKEDHESR